MKRRPTRRAPKSDAVQSAVKAMNEMTARHEQPLPAGIEAAWAEWSRGIGKVDARQRALLRAAFEVGVEAGQNLRPS
jgi:hypothetical protein